MSAFPRKAWERGWMLLLTLAIFAISATSQAAPRFVAALANGRQVEGERIFDWYNDNVQPRMDNTRLLDQGNPVQWLRDREANALKPPNAFVELVCGDRLPGVVREYMQGTEEANRTLPAHVVIEPRFEQRPPRDDPNLVVRAAIEHVQRIVWQRRPRNEYHPATLYLRDGGAITFRALRMANHSVSLLTDKGPRQFSFSEIAELHFPRRDAWEAHFDELAALTTDDKSRLMQMETTDGLIATGSLSRMTIQGHGGPDRYEFWIHGIQPGWSLDPLWVPCGNVIIRRFFAINEVPFYRLHWQADLKAGALGSGGPVQMNANAVGSLMRSGDRESGWGFGMHGAGEIAVSLHHAVRQFRGWIGLDHVAGDGGCVRGRVLIGKDTTSPVWQSNHLVGSKQVVSLGSIGIGLDPNKPETHQLRLEIDAAHQGRPNGADPWNIRDLVDWLDPLLVLDESIVRRELRARIPNQIAAWKGWRAVLDDDDSLTSTSYYSAIYPPMGRHRTLTSTKGEQSVRLVSTIPLTEESNWLIVLAAHREHTGNPAEIEVRIGGELAGSFKAPLLDPSHRDPEPLIVPLAAYRRNGAKELEVEIVRGPSDKPLDWRAISVVKHMPLFAALFDDSGKFVSQNDDAADAEISRAYMHSGEASVKVPAGQTVNLRFEHPLEVRSSPEWGQYRFIQFAFRKQGGGRVGIELDRPPGEERAARYDAGQGEPIEGQANRVWTLELPNEWVVMTRDLVSEFGEFNAEGLTLTVPDGEHAWFDHIFLARTRDDLALAPVAISPELANQKARRELASELLKQTLPAVVKLKMPDGRTGTGTIVSDEHVLTAGHLLVDKDRDLTVFLADGRELQGKSLGIDRENDLGLVKLSEKVAGQMNLNGDERLPLEQMYVGVIHRPGDEPGSEPQSHIVGIRRIVDGIIWTDFDTEEWTAGGPLFIRGGRIVGVLVSRSRFGGFQYLQGIEIQRSLERMKRSEVWGTWMSGSGPMVGVVIRTVNEGCRVVEVYPDSPAATAGLKPEDYITKVDGREVFSLGEIFALLKERNPGDKVRLTYVRGDNSHDTEMTLTPRWP